MELYRQDQSNCPTSYVEKGYKPGVRWREGGWWAAVLCLPVQHMGRPHRDLPDAVPHVLLPCGGA